MNKSDKINRKRENSPRFQQKQYGKYLGATDVPCFRCYLKTAGVPHKYAYIVRGVAIERFIDQQIRRGLMNTIEIVDYMYHELPHGKLFIIE